MFTFTKLLPVSLLLCVAALPAAAQVAARAPQAGPTVILNAADEAQRAARIALTGTLGFAPLPPLLANSPRDQLIFADRFPVEQQTYESSGGTPPTMYDGFLTTAQTGTIFPEIFKYQLGNSYDEFGPAHPMVIVYHGFGSSANSVAGASTLDEECDARGYIYASPTGLDDQLFGSPISQKHVKAMIQWLLDNFNVDPDRIFMVGFSMGGGVVTNFAARHRDPADIMIAGLGTVSAAMDWTQTYNQGTAGTQALLENIYNFGADPAAVPFKYRRSSGLYFTEGTYPPLPGVVDTMESMATNLGSIPTYITYDSGDPLTQIPGTNETFESLLLGLGATPTKVVQTGTLGGDGLPAPHSWAVLDEAELFDFWDGLTVNRYPEDLVAQQDLGGPASWMSTTQGASGAFTYVEGSANPLTGIIDINSVENAAVVDIDLGATALAGSIRVTASAAPGEPYTLRLSDLASPPSYLLDHSSGSLVTLVDSDPSTGSIFLDLAAGTSIDVDLVFDPQWTSSLTSSPNPVPINSASTVLVDCPSNGQNAWLIIGLQELLLPIKGVTLTASPIPPAILILLPLDASGDTSFPATIPNDPLFSGLRIPIQLMTLDAQNTPFSVSNLWGFKID